MNKKIKLFLLICSLLTLSSCIFGKLHNYQFISGNYTSMNEKPINIPIYNKGKKEANIVVDKVLIKLTEITKDKYLEADSINVIEDNSLKKEKRKYYSIELIFIIDNNPINVETVCFKCWSNKKEFYFGLCTINGFTGDIDLYNYGEQIKLSINGKTVVLNKE